MVTSARDAAMRETRLQLPGGVRLCALLLLAGLTTSAHATAWLREVVQQAGGEASQEIEVLLGAPVELTTPFREVSPTEFSAAARSTGEDSPEREFAELYFDEGQGGLARVTLDGSARNGFEITMRFREPVRLETLPQYSSTRLTVIYTDMKTFKRLDRFASRPASDQAPVAVAFHSASALKLGTVTPELAVGHPVYRNPEDADEVRIGFYTTETAATVTLRALRGEHPDVRLVRVSAGEVEYAKVYNLYPERLLARYGAVPSERREEEQDVAALPVVKVQPVTPSTIDTPPVPVVEEQRQWDEELDRSILDQAQDAYTSGDYDTAITLYTKAQGDPRLREEAMEMLGVSRERNGQLAHAKAQYERFLSEYPDGPAAARVSQRLTSLIGSDAALPQLRTPEHARDRGSWYAAANVSQFYQRYSLDISHQDTTVPVNGLFSDLNLIARRQSASATHEARFDAGHLWDFSDDEDSTTRVHRLSWSSFFERPGLGFRIGRQSRNDAGILGRYDGVTLTWRMADALTWNVIGGYVAKTTYDNPTTDRPVYGVNAEIELMNGNLEFTPFFVEQQRDGVVDRRAIGAHSVLFTRGATFSNLVDYDVYHQVLNNLVLNASVNLSSAWRLSGAYDFRRSPYLTTSNALIGQRYDDLSELEKSLVDMKLDDLADDRTATAHLGRLGLFGNLNDTWSVSVDGSVSHYSDTNDSLGVTGLDGRTDYYVTAQIRANDLFAENTFTSVQARYMGSETSETTQFYFMNRLALDNWNIFPKLVLGRRTYKTSDQNQDQIAPSLRVDYRGFRRFRLEAEAGYEWTSREQEIENLDIQGVFFRLGYRTLF